MNAKDTALSRSQSNVSHSIPQNITWHSASITRDLRESQQGHRSVVLWFTGLSGSGKSTVAHALEQALFAMRCHTFVLDGDNVRHGLCSNLGFSPADRTENVRRIGEVAKLFTQSGIISLAAFISPYRKDREFVRNVVGHDDFMEIYCRCSLEICEQRDVKGLYRRARAGEIKEFTGVTSPYEEPEQPDLVLDTGGTSLTECVTKVTELLAKKGIVSGSPSLATKIRSVEAPVPRLLRPSAGPA